MMLRLLFILTSVALALSGAPTGAQAPAREAIPGLKDRLRALEPTDPEGYLLLGEEVIAEIPGRQGRDLGRTLLVLAFELDQRRSTAQGVGASACLALASIAATPAEARWLSAMASAIDGREPLVSESTAGPAGTDRRERDEARITLARAIALARAQEGAELSRMLDDPDVRRVLEDTQPLLDGAERMFEDIERRPVCMECGNRRTVPSRDRDGPPLRLCPTCGANPGARLNDDEFVGTLAAEVSLLGVEVRSWSAQLMIDGGAPAREADISSLGAFYNVDPASPLWRPGADGTLDSGSWVPTSAP